ncbi:hypothetical protein VB712_14185 [Spirulina sp. CCNP1310]|uniref:hypothetical protein n=1 Tax=Spirulina sp. CCNP1310 TaxID=3110249 RepID=UPI002B209971|nr:hypothetical protein [Spirulina sp. CCNP1310]MEA5420377.1 hypothetical protein [Spirulina sp. CCNP1310]
MIGQRWYTTLWSTATAQKLTQLLLLSVTIATLSIMGLVVGSSLFLTTVGPQGLPVAYVAMGIVSLPIYLGLSQIVDRIDRPRLVRRVLGMAIALTLLLRLLLWWGKNPGHWLDYLLYIGFYIQWILLLEVLLPSLVTDYFTSLDWNRYASWLRMAMAVGGVIGGGLATGLARWWATVDLLWILPLLAALAAAQVWGMERSLHPIENPKDESTPEGPRLSWAALGAYPIIVFLAASTFLFILLYCMAEYLYFAVYLDYFDISAASPQENRDELTQFIGTVRMINNVIPFVVLYLVTQPLLNYWGVGVMNLVYPLLTLGAFGGLAYQFTLPWALWANVNNDGLDDSLNQPIHSLNYNAVPYGWVGQVRAISNGLAYALGLAAAGLLLMAAQWGLTPPQIARGGVVLSGVFVLVRYGMGRSYVRSLLQMLRTGRVQWEEVGAGMGRLPKQYSGEIDELLTSGDRSSQILGLALATRLHNPQNCFPEVEPLLATADPVLRRNLIRFFSQNPHPTLSHYLYRHLESDHHTGDGHSSHLPLILEALLARRSPLNAAQLTRLLDCPDTTVQALACVAVAAQDNTQFAPQCQRIWQDPLNEQERLTVIGAIRHTRNPRLIPIVQQLLAEGSVEVVRAGLETLARLARPGETALVALVERELTTFDPLVRAIALQLVGVLQNPRLLLDVAVGLEHESLAVRLWAAQALGNYGNKSLRVAKVYLASRRFEVVEAAIAAIGRINSRQASDTLYDFLRPDYQRAAQIQQWLLQLPDDQPIWRVVQVMLADAQERIIARVFAVLRAMDREGLLHRLEKALHDGDRRRRANAIETLAAGPLRRFIVPIMTLLETEDRLSPAPNANLLTKRGPLIEALLASDDRWLRVAGIFVQSQQQQPLPEALLQDPNPLVQRLAISLQDGQQTTLPDEDWFLKQLLFLKTQSWLQSLSLDELETINWAFNQRDFRAGEVICAPPEDQSAKVNPHHQQLYLIYDGDVLLASHGVILTVGEGFGVMHLWEDTAVQFKAIAHTECSLLSLSRARFNRLVDRCPRLLGCIAQVADITELL